MRGRSGKALAVADFAWSPVANEVALESTSGKLWLAVAGQAARQISPGSRRVAGPLAWSPDGTQIAYASASQGRPSYGQLDAFTVAGQRTKSVQRLANTGFLVADWLPGNTLLYWQDPYFSSSIAADGLWIYCDVLPGNHPRRLVQTLPYPDWIAPASDGKTVAVVAGTSRETGVNKSVALCTGQTGQCQRTGEKSGVVPPAGAGIWDPTSDPGQSLLLYVRSHALWMFSTETWHATQITGTLAVPGGPAGQLGYYGHLAWNTEWT